MLGEVILSGRGKVTHRFGSDRSLHRLLHSRAHVSAISFLLCPVGLKAKESVDILSPFGAGESGPVKFGCRLQQTDG